MKISYLILGRSSLLLSGIGLLATATFLTTGCGQRGPLFLAPQSVPYTLLPTVKPANLPANALPAPAPAPAASVAR